MNRKWVAMLFTAALTASLGMAAFATEYESIDITAGNAAQEDDSLDTANVKHFFTLLGNDFFTSYGKQFFTLYGKKIFTLYGKQFFTLPGREFFTSLSGSRLSRQVLCQLKISGCLSR